MRIIVLILFVLIRFSVNAQDLGNLWEKYNQKHYDIVLEQALPLLKDYPDNMDLNLLIGRSYTETRNSNKAIPYLKKVIENDVNRPNKAWSLSYLGQCYYYIDSIDLAKEYLNACINLNATKNATNKAYGYLDYFSLTQFYDSWTIIDTPFIRFHFQNSKYDKEYVNLISKLYSELNKFFNAQTPKKLDFYIWDNSEEAKAILKMDLAIARYSTISIHTTYNNTKGHELTHILCYWGLNPKNMNNLITEGIAVYFDQTKRDRFKVAQDLLNNKELNIIDFWANPSNYPGDYCYAIGGALIDYLLKNGTDQQLKEILKDQSLNNARKVYKDFDKLMLDFNKKINGGQHAI